MDTTTTKGNELDPKSVQIAQDLGEIWIKRMSATKQVYEYWERRFHCRRAYEFYEGVQWKGSEHYRGGGDSYLPYTLNLFYATVETRLPSLTFSNPTFLLSPKPGKEAIAYDNPQIIGAIKLRQDALNTFVSDPDSNFMETMEYGILDAHFRFGIVEIGISDSWVENPTLTKPALKSDNMVDNGGQSEPGPDNIIGTQEEVPEEETIYVKHIPATSFRVNNGAKGRLSSVDFCGYYEYVRREDLASQAEFYKLMKYQSTLSFSAADGAYGDFMELSQMDPDSSSKCTIGDYVKIVHIFDNRLKQRHIINCNDSVVMGSIPFPGTKRGKPRMPLEDLRFSKSLRFWYGVPPASQWMSPQIEYNEERERLRGYARRMLRKFIVNITKFRSEAEMDKLMNGEDGVFAAADGDLDQIIRAIPTPSIAPETIQSAGMAKQDFDVASGVTSDQRGLATDRQTATQSRIVDQRATIRESRQANTVANFLCRIARQISLCQQELSDPFFIKTGNATDLSLVASEYKLITSDDFGDFDFNLNIALETISPLANEMRKNAFLEFLAIINQYPQFGLSTILVQEIAEKVGFRNTKVIEEFQQLALAQQMAMQQQVEASQGAMAQRTVAGATPPAQEQITNELQNQNGIPNPGQGVA